MFTRYRGKVRLWLTFNEINSIWNFPLMSAGILIPKAKLTRQDLYQAAHHELVASALAVKIGHEVDAQNQIGCMVLGAANYPRTCDPADMLAVMKENQDAYFFTDVHMRGRYPAYARKRMEREHIRLQIEEEDNEILKHTCDFLSFSYYMSKCLAAEPEKYDVTNANLS